MKKILFCITFIFAIVATSCVIYDTTDVSDTYSMYSIRMTDYANKTAYRAMAFDEERETIYAINDIAIQKGGGIYSQIDVLDYDGNLKANPITGFQAKAATNSNSTDATFERASDVKIHGGKLYVSSMSTCRVDVYALPASNETFIMSLGKGGAYTNNNGSDVNIALFHPKALAVTDDYIFVTEYINTIAVYRTDTITSANHLKATKYCRLSWPTNQSPRNRQQYIEYLNVIDGKLYASSDGLNEVYVWDISNLTSGATVTATDIQSLTGTAKLHSASVYDDKVAVTLGSANNNSRVAVVSKADFLKFDFSNPIIAFSRVGGAGFNIPKNIYFFGDIIYFNNISYPRDNDNVKVNDGSAVFKVEVKRYDINEL